MEWPEMRKYAAVTGEDKVVVEEGPCPKPGRGEILLEVKASLISPGTEMGFVKIRRQNPDPSTI